MDAGAPGDDGNLVGGVVTDYDVYGSEEFGTRVKQRWNPLGWKVRCEDVKHETATGREGICGSSDQHTGCS